MTIKTRYSNASEWKIASAELIEYYFGTNDAEKIAAQFSGKRTVKKMNLYFMMA